MKRLREIKMMKGAISPWTNSDQRHVKSCSSHCATESLQSISTKTLRLLHEARVWICLKLMHGYLLAKLQEENKVWLQDQFNLYEDNLSNVISHSPQVSRPHRGYCSRGLVCDFNYMYSFLFYCLYFITLMWFISQHFDIIQIWNSIFYR